MQQANRWQKALLGGLTALLAFIVAAGFVLILGGSAGRISPGLLPFLGIATLVLVGGIIYAIMLLKKRTGPQEMDYRMFFILGLIWLPLGLMDKSNGLSAMGLIFIAIGLTNKDKWKNNLWCDLPPGRRWLKIVLMVILGVLVAAATAWLITAGRR